MRVLADEKGVDGDGAGKDGFRWDARFCDEQLWVRWVRPMFFLRSRFSVR